MGTYNGTSGNDTLNGSIYGDDIYGGAGNDTGYGGDGSDNIYGGTGNDSLYGGNGNDGVSGGHGNDQMDGGAGDDIVVGGQGGDTLYGNTGNDTMLGDGQWLTLANYVSNSGGSNTTLTITNNADGPIVLKWVDANGVAQVVTTIQAGATYSFSTLTSNNYVLTDPEGFFLEPISGTFNQTVTYSPPFGDVIYGGANDDSILGQYGNDTIYGDDGNDVLRGGTGNDMLYGGLGNDTLNGDEGNDIAYGGDGNDSVSLGAGDDTFGDWGLDGGDDNIDGGAGNDYLIGGAGNDTVWGGDGNDSLSGAIGQDTLYGGAGSDLFAITDDHQGDTLFGGESSGDFDQINFWHYASAQGVVVTYSGNEAGSYDYIGTDGAGTFAEIEGVVGTNFADTINAAATTTSTFLASGEGNDLVTGGAGNDTIYFGTGADTVYGGAGNDQIDDADGMASDTYHNLIDAGAGDDTVWSGDGSDTVYGGTGNDVISGEAGNDTIIGGDGADYLYGGEGHDSLDGALGADLLVGDAGNDVLNLTAADSANDSAYGGAGNDTLTSRIDTAGGNDTLYGGDGRDVFVAGAGDSIVGGEGGDDFDTVDLSSSSVGSVVTLTGTGIGTVSGGGQTLNFTEIEAITGTSQADVVYGGSDSGGMTYSAGAGDDTVTGGAGADSIHADAGNDSVTGGGGNDTLRGGDGNDSLSGGSGNDSLAGGAGFDRFTLIEAGGGDTVSDFDMGLSDGLTTDQLDVSGLKNPDDSPVRAWDVTVVDDGNGNTLLTFPEGESLLLQGVDPATVAAPGMLAAMGVPCFAAGTRIATPKGPIAVERLGVGDLVTLADGGQAPVIWSGHRHLSAAQLAAKPNLRPIRIKAGSHGAVRDLILSPQHAVAVSMQGTSGLIRAAHLARLNWGARQALGIVDLRYHHILLPRHAVILAEGVRVETFYPGRMAFAALAAPDRAALHQAVLGADSRGQVSSLILAYGPRCLPLLSFADARRAQAAHQSRFVPLGNQLPQRVPHVAL